MSPPMMENHMEKSMEHDMETRIMYIFFYFLWDVWFQKTWGHSLVVPPYHKDSSIFGFVLGSLVLWKLACLEFLNS